MINLNLKFDVDIDEYLVKKYKPPGTINKEHQVFNFKNWCHDSL